MHIPENRLHQTSGCATRPITDRSVFGHAGLLLGAPAERSKNRRFSIRIGCESLTVFRKVPRPEEINRPPNEFAGSTAARFKPPTGVKGAQPQISYNRAHFCILGGRGFKCFTIAPYSKVRLVLYRCCGYSAQGVQWETSLRQGAPFELLPWFSELEKVEGYDRGAFEY